MARLRSLIARFGTARVGSSVALVAALLLPAGFGCASLKKTKSGFAQALHLEPPKPASQVICFWQRRPQHLPDPSRDGVLAPGIVGQLFLIGSDKESVEVTGDLVVQALDETRRPPGQPSAMTEIWSFDKAALRKLATSDDRFGTCYAIFLPWPAGWKDVTNVRMQAKYISKPNPDLFAKDVSMTLDFSDANAKVWNKIGETSVVLQPTGPSELRGIPDLNKAFQNQPAGLANRPPPPNLGIPKADSTQPASFAVPQSRLGEPTQYLKPGRDGSTVETKTWVLPVPTQFTPTVTPPPLPIPVSNFNPAVPLQPSAPAPIVTLPTDGSLQTIVIPRN